MPLRSTAGRIAFALACCAATAFADDLRTLDSPGAAVEALLEKRPRVAAFGEFHQTEGTAGIPSAIHRFTEQILPLIAPRASDLIVETWITKGECGAQETKVVANVAKTTERPAETENEIVTLVKRARAAGVQPHILEMDCRDYRSLLQQDGELDFAKLLKLTRVQLEKNIRALLAARPASTGKMIMVYGGALHNDLYPDKLLQEFAFGRAVHRLTKGAYQEIDLYVPEYIEGNEAMAKEPWFARFRAGEKPGKTLLIRRGTDSHIVIFERTKR